MVAYRQHPVQKQCRQGRKQDGHHHIAEEMPAGRDAKTGHENDCPGGKGTNYPSPIGPQARPDKHTEGQEKLAISAVSPEENEQFE